MNFRRHSRLLLLALLFATPTLAHAQLSRPIRTLESAIWKEIESRALRSRGLTMAHGEFDLRLTMHGEPEEVRGTTNHAANALAIASVRLEAADTLVDSPDARIGAGRYDLRIEDRAGHCAGIHQNVLVDSSGTVTRGARMVETCRPLYMADVVRRGRRVARLPLVAGDLADHWSVASALTGWVDVYADSVVILANTLDLRANYPTPDTLVQHVDSIAVGLAMGSESWSTVRRSRGLALGATLRPHETWSRKSLRFTIPIDSAVALGETWPVVEVVLRVPRTKVNPIGRAWTYAHAPTGFFRTVSPLPR